MTPFKFHDIHGLHRIKYDKCDVQTLGQFLMVIFFSVSRYLNFVQVSCCHSIHNRFIAQAASLFVPAYFSQFEVPKQTVIFKSFCLCISHAKKLQPF